MDEQALFEELRAGVVTAHMARIGSWCRARFDQVCGGARPAVRC
jgi:hypothetical protein